MPHINQGEHSKVQHRQCQAPPFLCLIPTPTDENLFNYSFRTASAWHIPPLLISPPSSPPTCPLFLWLQSPWKRVTFSPKKKGLSPPFAQTTFSASSGLPHSPLFPPTHPSYNIVQISPPRGKLFDSQTKAGPLSYTSSPGNLSQF